MFEWEESTYYRKLFCSILINANIDGWWLVSRKENESGSLWILFYAPTFSAIKTPWWILDIMYIVSPYQKQDADYNWVRVYTRVNKVYSYFLIF